MPWSPQHFFRWELRVPIPQTQIVFFKFCPLPPEKILDNQNILSHIHNDMYYILFT